MFGITKVTVYPNSRRCDIHMEGQLHPVLLIRADKRAHWKIHPEEPMPLQKFIRDNRDEIDAAIKRVCDNCRLNDSERRLWILNDEGLYRWARREGVRI